MEFEVLFVTACHISLQPGKVTFFGRRQLVEYVVGDIIMDASKTNSSFSGLQAGD
ncbi:hypothetical protein SK128_000474 [Halocaridina rubra]|uniref:Uncharacterized protein n=1 Tax=Halocaridina rubra TaxID=373956 RepID=A0AAN8X2V0_HALRR